MAQRQDIGDSKGLNKGATTSPSSSSPQGTIQKIGDSEPLGRTPIQTPTQKVKEGTRQGIGTSIALGRTQTIPFAGQAGLSASPETLDRSKRSGRK